MANISVHQHRSPCTCRRREGAGPDHRGPGETDGEGCRSWTSKNGSDRVSIYIYIYTTGLRRHLHRAWHSRDLSVSWSCCGVGARRERTSTRRQRITRDRQVLERILPTTTPTVATVEPDEQSSPMRVSGKSSPCVSSSPQLLDNACTPPHQPPHTPSPPTHPPTRSQSKAVMGTRSAKSSSRCQNSIIAREAFFAMIPWG